MQIPSESSSACGSSKLFTKFYRDLGNFGGSGQQKRCPRRLYYLTSQKRTSARDRFAVLGVARCAARRGETRNLCRAFCVPQMPFGISTGPYMRALFMRSEERRVGKDGIDRWW